MIFIASGICCAFILLRPKSSIVEIISDGKVIYTIDLAKEKDRLITVEFEGRKNIIAVENGDIYMKEADCPDRICIKTGRLSSSGVPIVCMPDHLMIRYAEGKGEGDIDAAAN